jgi:DNA-directed RNA polymerase specialized sigma24 family protein
MPEDGDRSITHWISALKDGDLAAAQPLWERYFKRLAGLARRRLRASRPTGVIADGEDVALSALDSLFEGARRGRFPLLSDRGDLWRLLVVITARKAAAEKRRAATLKRGNGRVWTEAELAAATPDESAGLEEIVGREPTPEFAAQLAEEWRGLFDFLDNEGLRQVALWRMEGYAVDEIAARLGCTRRTVARRLDLIRRAWLTRSN